MQDFWADPCVIWLLSGDWSGLLLKMFTQAAPQIVPRSGDDDNDDDACGDQWLGEKGELASEIVAWHSESVTFRPSFASGLSLAGRAF